VENVKKYNIGLDIGVASVGWCVTDMESNILKKGNKNMWGSRIFEEAETAANRRSFRSSKRRLTRRKERIRILQDLLNEDMEKEYPNFFPMLKETSLNYEDKKIDVFVDGKKFNLFSENGNTDKNYYAKFPTIYHLRKYLINTNEKVDIRLVYLAIHHIIKYRGNFLYEGDFSENINAVNEKIQNLIEYLESNYQIIINGKAEDFINILIKKDYSKSRKKELLLQLFNYDKSEKPIIVNVINAIVGSPFEINKIFDTELEKSKISFSTEIEEIESIKDNLGENLEIFNILNEIYSWYTLQDILKGKKFISEAFIEKYNKYSDDLELLKKIYKKYFKSEYSSMFRKDGNDNYVAYNGKSCGKTYKKCAPEAFFNSLKKQMEKLPDNVKEKEIILNGIADNTFLEKINVTENGAIPYQLHMIELEKIVNNQAKYYKTLEENKNKILQLFSFRIPYYVGPLAKKAEGWAWLVRKSDDKIMPWNFGDVVDEDATAEEFIKRMTNKCTYLINEDVIPKQSLLYSYFCVLNELNNIRINNKHIAKDMKLVVIRDLFQNKKKVTLKMLKDYYKKNAFSCDIVTGLQDGENFNSSLTSYIDMKNIFGSVNEQDIEKYEKIIYWITVFEEKKILKRKIKKSFPEITDEQLKKLLKLNYSGWSRLSKKMLEGLKSYDGDNVIEKLEKTSLNFMQIINSEKFGINKKIEELLPVPSKGITYKDIEDIPTSPANKRAIWQSICIVKEIVSIMKTEPSNIYIEFARNEEKKKQMKDARTKQLLKKYEDINNQLRILKEYDSLVYKQLKKHQSDKILTEKLYLYFIQNGKCLYSRKPLNIDELDKYEVDHIIPQSYIKDDSLDNKALVIKRENQRKKDSLLLDDKIINDQEEWWKSLLDAGLISQNKYYKLVRRKMFETEEEKDKFVQRQLVETRQITKYVTNLLINEYEKTEIFAIRSNLTHEFREEFKLYKNRNVNNYHHAQDAYILNVIGNIIKKHMYNHNEFKYSEYVKKHKDENNKNSNVKYSLVMSLIRKYVEQDLVEEVMGYKDCYLSRMLIENTGEFYHQTLYSPSQKPVIPLKKGMPVEKYGGYSNENKAYCSIFKYTNQKNKVEYELIGIPIQISYEIKQGKITLEEYVSKYYLKEKKFYDLVIVKEKILINQEYLDENNNLMRLCSDKEIRSSKELIVDKDISEIIYLMNKDEKHLDDEQIEMIEKEYSVVFDYLVKKLDKEYKIFESTVEKLKTKYKEFENSSSTNKKLIINGLIDLMSTGQGNLKAIGLADREGRKSGQTFKNEKLLNMTFIDKSITGMYERRYKINGMENCSSK